MFKTGSRWFLIILLAIIPLCQLAIDIYLPSLPSMVNYFHSNQTSLQYTVSFYILGVGVSQLLCGPISDCYGRRKITLIGIAAFLFATTVSIWVNDISIFNALRFLQGLSMGFSSFVITCAIMGEVYQGSRLAQVTSYSSMSYALVPIIAPVIGGYLQEYSGWQANFWFMAIYALLLLIVCTLFLPETMQQKNMEALKPKVLLRDYRKFVTHKVFIAYLICMSFGNAAFLCFAIIAPFLLQGKFHLSPSTFGLYALVVGIAYLIGTSTNSRLVSHFALAKLIMIGICIMLVSGLVLFIADFSGTASLTTTIITTAIAIFSIGFIFPNCMAGSIATFRDRVGVAMGFLASVILVIGMVFTSILAEVQNTSAKLLGGVFILLALGSLISFIVAVKPFAKINLAKVS